MTSSSADTSVTGEILYEATFDARIANHGRMFLSLIFLATIVGIVIIPFFLLFSLWYYPEFLRRISARVTTQAVEIRKGVFFRKEATIPLNRITDVRLHDGPLMRYYSLRGVTIETAGQGGPNASSEGNLIGMIDVEKFRDVVLVQRQKVIGVEEVGSSRGPGSNTDEILTEIRDILTRIEDQGRSDSN